MANKIKKPQAETPYLPQGRDLFQTPNYATKLLIPFIPRECGLVWECAAGEGKIANVLKEYGFFVYQTDIIQKPNINEVYNFLKGVLPPQNKAYTIITNPPFSLKKKFYKRCLASGFKFALLIPADYSGWIIDAIKNDGAEKIIPTRRIDYMTPSGLSGATGHTANFHSMWLTRGFNLGKTETFVELTTEMKKDI